MTRIAFKKASNGSFVIGLINNKDDSDHLLWNLYLQAPEGNL